MPPKVTKKKKKGKITVAPVAKPEPPEPDEIEIASVYDRIGKMGPNPLSKSSVIYNQVTSQVVNSGPLPSVVIGMASATMPLLPPRQETTDLIAPITLPSVSLPPAPGTGEKEGEASSPATGGAKLSAGAAAPTTNSNEATPQLELEASTGNVSKTPEGGSQSARIQLTSHVAVPRPPQRRIPETARVSYRLIDAERKEIEAERHFAATVKELEDIKNVIAEEFKNFIKESENFQEVWQELEAKKHDFEVSEEEQLANLQQEFLTEQKRLEFEIEEKMNHRDAVLRQLEDKRITLSELAAHKEEFEAMERRHTSAMIAEGKRLAELRRSNESTMNSRLHATIGEMLNETSIQSQVRQQRAMNESSRLVRELTMLESQSKELNKVNTKLMHRLEAVRRDLVLESERKELLLKKNKKLTNQISGVVTGIQQIEKDFVAKTHSDTDKREVTDLSATVDQQYQLILHLKSELDQARQDAEDMRNRVIESRRTQLLQQGHAQLAKQIGTGKAVTEASASGALVPMQSTIISSAQPQKITPRDVIIDSVVEIDKALRNISGSSIDAVNDPPQQLRFVNYIIQRLNTLEQASSPL